jgi:hypothetical protein
MKSVHAETMEWLNAGNRPIFPESLDVWNIPVIPGIRMCRWIDLAVHKAISVRDGHSGNCDHPLFREIVADTFGYLVSAEQIAQALSIFGGLTKDEATHCRREFAKRKASYLDAESTKLIDYAMAHHGMSYTEASDILDLLYEVANSWREVILCNLAWRTYVAAYLMMVREKNGFPDEVWELSSHTPLHQTSLEGKSIFISVTSQLKMSVAMIETLVHKFHVPFDSPGNQDISFGGFEFVFLKWHMPGSNDEHDPLVAVTELMECQRRYASKRSAHGCCSDMKYRLVLLANFSWYDQYGIDNLENFQLLADAVGQELPTGATFELQVVDDTALNDGIASIFRDRKPLDYSGTRLTKFGS